MSAVDEGRQRWGKAARRAATWPARSLGWVLRLALVALAVVLLGLGVLAWRLSQGPVDVGWLVRRIEAAALPKGAPSRLAIGAASIVWNGFQHGAGGGLELKLSDVRIVNRSGAPGARVQEADVTLSLRRLLELELAPRSIAVEGLRLRAVRTADRDIILDLGSLNEGDAADDDNGPTLADTLAELRRPARGDRTRAPPGLELLSQLRRVRVHDARFELVDREFGATLRASVASLDLERQPGGGVKGAASGQVALGDAIASLQLGAALTPAGGTHVEAALAPIQATDLAQSNPALASLGALNAALQARASLDLDRRLLPRAGDLHASTGAGTLSLAGGNVGFERLALDGAASWSGQSWRPDHADLQRALAVIAAPGGAWPTTLELTGNAVRRGGKIEAQLQLAVDHFGFADVPSLWPAAWGGNVRPWVVQNLTTGTARDGAFRLTLTAAEANPMRPVVTAAGGTLQAEDVTIHWLRPVPPIERAHAQLRVVGPDVIDIAVPSAAQGPIALRDGLIRITGLSAKDQFMTITASPQGPVPDLIQLLRHPRLRLLDRHPVPIKSSAGKMAGKLSVELPLERNLRFEQVKIAAQGRLTGLRLGGVVAGRDLENGDIQFDVTTDALKASGPASVAAIPGAISVDMDFRSGPPTQVVQRASMTGKATARQLAAAGLDPGSLVTSGQIGLAAAYSSRRDGEGQVAVKADFGETGLALAGWRKPPGPPAEASANLLLRNDKLVGIGDILAQGPGLRVAGRAEMVGARPLLLVLNRIVLGRTEASGEVRLPERGGQPIRARLSGAVLDLSEQFSSKPGRRATESESEDGWIADIRFDRVLTAKERGLTGVTAHAEHDGRRITRLEATSTGPERLQAVIAPNGSGRRVSVRAADGGALLRGLDVIDTVHGGALALEAQYDDRHPDPPLAGRLDLSGFGVRGGAAGIGKLLQAVSVYGIVEAVQGEGVQFARLIMPFRFAGRVLEIGQTQAFSASLGLTAHGRIDLNNRTADVTGTVVPVYALNSALGRIPVIGRLFSPERGGGLVAVQYSVTGALADPNVVVNPLSALTPGFLRGLFSMFGRSQR